MKKQDIFILSDKKRSSELVDGISEKVLVMINGEKVMIKGDTNRESYAEYFASKLGEELGLNINKVILTPNGELFGLCKVSSIHWWEDDFEPGDHYKYMGEDEMILMNFFDAIIDNDDRHAGNYGVVGDELFLIDHGTSGPWREWKDKEYATAIERAINNKEVLPYVERFLSLTEDKLWALSMPPIMLLEEFNKELFDEVFNRMLKAQKYIKLQLKKVVN